MKSMMGDELDASMVAERGLLGDRSYALQDVETGRIVSAKNPKKFAKLLEFKATFVKPPVPGQNPPAVMFSFPMGASRGPTILRLRPSFLRRLAPRSGC